MIKKIVSILIMIAFVLVAQARDITAQRTQRAIDRFALDTLTLKVVRPWEPTMPTWLASLPRQ